MITSKAELKKYIERDRIVNCGSSNILFPNKIHLFLRQLRYVEYYGNTPSFIHKILWIIAKIRLRRLSYQLGFSIPPNVFGPGLSIPHYGTIVVNPKTKVGENCRLHVGVNIGTTAGESEAPKLGNNIYIGPGAILFGNIEIANNITIGANATVNKSFKIEYSVLAGTPAKIVKTDSPNWLQFNKTQHQTNNLRK